MALSSKPIGFQGRGGKSISSEVLSPGRTARQQGLQELISHLKEQGVRDSVLSSFYNLAQETRSDNFDKILHLQAGRLSRMGQDEASQAAYQMLAQDLPDRDGKLSASAQESLLVMSGQGGSLGRQIEHHAGRFLKEATHPSMVLGMAFGVTAFNATRAMVLPSLMRSSSALLSQVPFATRAAASSIALVPEVGAFWGTSKVINEVMHPGTNVWDVRTNAQEILGLGMTLGFLKSFGFAFGRAGALAKAKQWDYLPKHPVFWQQSGMLTGIMAGHGTEISLGWRAPTDISTFLTDSFITLGHFNMGGALSHQMFPGIYRLNGRIQQKMAAQERAHWEKIQGGLGALGFEMVPAVGPSNPGENIGPSHLIQMKGIDNPAVPTPSIGPKGEILAKPTGEERGIQLPVPSNTHSLIQLAEYLIEQHPDVLGHIKVPSSKRMIKEYPKFLTEIELARVNSEKRVEIAQTARDWVLNRFRFIHQGGKEVSLKEMMQEVLENPLPWTREEAHIEKVLPSEKEMGPGYRGIIRHDGVVLDSLNKILNWSHNQLFLGNISPSLAAKIEWSAKEAYSKKARAEGRYGHFRFHNPGEEPRKVVLVSGGAELAPLKFFTEAGAEVLVVDLYPLGAKVDVIKRAPGGLYSYQGDILTKTPQVAGAILAFAGEGKVDLGFYPYKGGLVWLLSAATEAITLGVGDKARTTFTLRSPSVMAEVPPETAEISDQRWSSQTFGSIGNQFIQNTRGGKNQKKMAQSVVRDQRLPYAVGNWLGKTISTEARIGDGGIAYAPVGPIAFTGSMTANKLITYGLKAAHLFDVGVVQPYTSRDIQAFVLYHDFKNQVASLDYTKTPVERSIAATSDHADMGIFSQAHAMGSLVYSAGIMGILGVDGRKSIPTGLKKGKAGSYIAPEKADQLQRVLQQLKGPLAWAFAEHLFKGTQVEQLYSGAAAAIRKSSDRWGMRLMNTWNQLSFMLPGTREKFARGNKVFGKLLLTHLMRMKQRGDQILLTLNEEGQLASIFLQKPNGQGMEYRLAEREPQDPTHIHRFEQTIHLGKPWEGQDQLTQIWKYDAKKGDLRSTGPNRINPEILNQPIPLGEVKVGDPAASVFERLFGPPAPLSLTYPVNLALRRSFEKILEDAQSANPNFKIDPMRSVVHGIKIHRSATQEPGGLFDMEMDLTPLEIREVRQGQLLESRIKITSQGEEQLRATLTALVHGNKVEKPENEARLEDRQLVETGEKPFREILRVMGKQELDQYGRFFDGNVLHQRPIVAQAAGFKGTPNPGVELMAEFESLILSKAKHFGLKKPILTLLEARFDKPAFEGQEYLFESGFDAEAGLWRFQIFEPKSRRVRIEGSYQLNEVDQLPSLDQVRREFGDVTEGLRDLVPDLSKPGKKNSGGEGGPAGPGGSGSALAGLAVGVSSLLSTQPAEAMARVGRVVAENAWVDPFWLAAGTLTGFGVLAMAASRGSDSVPPSSQSTGLRQNRSSPPPTDISPEEFHHRRVLTLLDLDRDFDSSANPPVISPESLREALTQRKDWNLPTVDLEALDRPDYDPIPLFKSLQNDPILRSLFALRVGELEPIDLDQHTSKVLGLHERFFSDRSLPGGLKLSTMRLLLIVHDMGKPLALASDSKSGQHELNPIFLETLFERWKVDPAQTQKALALLNSRFGSAIRIFRRIAQMKEAYLGGDSDQIEFFEKRIRENYGLEPEFAEKVIGEFRQVPHISKSFEDYAQDKAHKAVRSGAEKMGIHPWNFLNLTTRLHQVDGGAWTTFANDGKPQIPGQKSSAFDDLFFFDPENNILSYNDYVRTQLEFLAKSEGWQITYRPGSEGIESKWFFSSKALEDFDFQGRFLTSQYSPEEYLSGQIARFVRFALRGEAKDKIQLIGALQRANSFFSREEGEPPSAQKYWDRVRESYGFWMRPWVPEFEGKQEVTNKEIYQALERTLEEAPGEILKAETLEAIQAQFGEKAQ